MLRLPTRSHAGTGEVATIRSKVCTAVSRQPGLLGVPTGMVVPRSGAKAPWCIASSSLDVGPYHVPPVPACWRDSEVEWAARLAGGISRSTDMRGRVGRHRRAVVQGDR